MNLIAALIGVLIGFLILAISYRVKKKPKNIFDAAREKELTLFKKYMQTQKNLLNAGDYMGLTPLMLAIINFNDVNLIRELIEAGAGVNYVDKKGNSALHYAVLNNNPDVVKVLINKGINKSHNNSEGKSALDIAKEKGLEVADLLY